MTKFKNQKIKNFFKKNFFWIFFVCIIMIVTIPTILKSQLTNNIKIENVDFSKNITMEVFYSESCIYCKEQEKYEKVLKSKYPNLIVIKYYTNQKETEDRYKQYAKKYPALDIEAIKTPTTIINRKNEYIVIGYKGDLDTGEKLNKWIRIENNNLLS